MNAEEALKSSMVADKRMAQKDVIVVAWMLMRNCGGVDVKVCMMCGGREVGVEVGARRGIVDRRVDNKE